MKIASDVGGSWWEVVTSWVESQFLPQRIPNRRLVQGRIGRRLQPFSGSGKDARFHYHGPKTDPGSRRNQVLASFPRPGTFNSEIV